MVSPKFAGIPAIPTGVAPEMRALLGPIRENLNRIVGGDLPQQGIINALSRIGYTDSAGNPTIPPGAIAVDSTPPPAPTGLTAGGAIANIILAWDAVPAAVKHRVAYTEVWRAETNDLSIAKLIDQTTARVYVDNIGAGGQRYYWIRYVSPAAIVPPITGPFNSQTGTLGETGYDAGYLIDVLTANPPPGSNFSALFYVQETPITIDGVLIPAGVYINQAIIRKLSVTNAMIANAAIDNAKIANLDAGKITTGILSADRIDTNAITASIAYIDAAIIDRGFLNTARIADASIGQAKIGGDISSSTWNGSTTGWYLDRDGEFYAGNGYFRGTIEATNGVFSGALQGATGTFSGVLSAATGVFSGDVYAQNFYGNVVSTGNINVGAITELYTASGEFGSSVVVPRIPGSKVMIHVKAESPVPGEGEGGQTPTMTVLIRRNGIGLASSSSRITMMSFFEPDLVDIPSAQNVTYSVEIIGVTSGSYGFIAVQQFKR